MVKSLPKNIKLFVQHGFNIIDKTDNQYYGSCVFCGKKNKFYINIDSSQWDCKSCGKNGNKPSFLKEMVKTFKDKFNKKQMLKINKLKKIPVSILEKSDFCYNPVTDTVFYPTYYLDTDKISDLRFFTGKRFFSTASCVPGLKWENQDANKPKILLLEGEFDYLIAKYLINKENLDNEFHIACVPGANIFRNEWVYHFKDLEVFILFDNDEPGLSGVKKVYKKVKNVAKSVSYLKWPVKLAKGYDLRDLFMDNRNLCVNDLLDFKSSKILDLFEKDEIDEENIDIPQTFNGKFIPLRKIKEIFEKWIYLEDYSVIDVILATIVANRLSGNPLWLFLVAPSGGAKTELLLSLNYANEVFTTTTLTPHSLVSGAPGIGGNDPSLIPKLNNKILVIKDFTTILNMNQMARDEIFAILRDAFDGSTGKNFGNGIYRSYKSKFGIIAGVTPVIELYTEDNVMFGERFLRFNIPFPQNLDDKLKILEKVIDNNNKENNMKKDLASIIQQALKFDYLSTEVELPVEIRDKILKLAVFCSILRSSIKRDKFTKEITHHPFTEIGSRLAKQFSKLAIGLALLKRKNTITNIEYRIVKKVAFDTCPTLTTKLLNIIYNDRSKSSTTEELSKIISLPKGTVNKILMDLLALKLVERKNLTGVESFWNLSDFALKIITESGIFVKKG